MSIESQPMFAKRRPDGSFEDIHPSRGAVEMCGSGAVVPVLLTIDPRGAYWCWRDSATGRLSMVFDSRDLLAMCFPHGIGYYERQGKGQAVRVTCTDATTAGT